jgi:hypothetical protein
MQTILLISCNALANFPLQTTFEESRLNEADVGDKQKWLKEGMDCNLLYWNGKVFPILLFQINCLSIDNVHSHNLL